MVVGGLLCRLYNAQYQGFADDVVLLQKFKLVSTLCDRIQGTLNCGENWFKEIGLSVNADMKIMVLFTNNKKIGDFYNPRRFGTELRMADQVKYLGVILDNMQYACIAYWQCHRAVGKTWGLSPKVVARLYTSVVRLVCFARMMEESGAEKCSETALSLAADDVFGNYWWYAFNTIVCFRGYDNVATLTFVHKTRDQKGS
jgi:hypothetical protein